LRLQFGADIPHGGGGEVLDPRQGVAGEEPGAQRGGAFERGEKEIGLIGELAYALISYTL